MRLVYSFLFGFFVCGMIATGTTAPFWVFLLMMVCALVNMCAMILEAEPVGTERR